MSDDELVEQAINATYQGQSTFMKFLSANDSGETGGHQAGILINRRAMHMIFGNTPSEKSKRTVQIVWQDDVTTHSTFTWYTSKKELRLTGFGRGFGYLAPEMTGSLFVLVQITWTDYKAYVLSSEEEMDAYLSAFSLGPQDSGLMFTPSAIVTVSDRESAAIRDYVLTTGVASGTEFPSTETVSAEARAIEESLYDHAARLLTAPDTKLLSFTRIEYAIFREMERQAYGHRIASGFSSVDDFVELANKVLNRRKSRAGKSFEHHLSAIFLANDLPFEEQVVTEGNKRPDFVFPSSAAYHDVQFPNSKLIVLAAKTTCKDRWRQILSEAERAKEGPHYLVTLQQGNSSKQLEEMLQDNVQLIVPQQYISSYPAAYQDRIWSLKRFVDFARERLS